MSPAVEDFLSPSSSSTQRSYFQNPNPSAQGHFTDSGIFNNSFNLMNSSKLDFDCSNDAAAAEATTVRSSRRKHVKVKKQSSCNGPVSKKSDNSTRDTTGFVFNATTSGSVLSSSLGKTGCDGNDERQRDGEVLDFNLMRFTMGVTNNNQLGNKMGAEKVQKSGNNFQSGDLNFVFGADDEMGDNRKASERGSNKFGKLNGVDILFGANMNNGVLNSNSSNIGHEHGREGVGLHLDDSESSGTVRSSGIDGFMKVNNFKTMPDFHLVNSMSFLNLGSKGSGEAAPSMNSNLKTEENNTSDSKKFENLGFVFSANHRDFQTDSSIGKQKSKEKVDKLAPESANRNVDSGVIFGNNKVNGIFHIGTHNEKKSSFKGNMKVDDETNIMKSQGAGSSDHLKKQGDNVDSVLDGNSTFVFGSNLGNAFGDNPQCKVPHDTKTSNIHDPTKVSTTKNKINEAGTTNNFSFSSNASFTGFNTPDINIPVSFTSDMFPGLGKKLEFSKNNSVSQRKLKKTKAKVRQQSSNRPQVILTHLSEGVTQSCEESPGSCSPMDVSPYWGAADCAPTSTNPATSQVQNEDAVDTTEKLGAQNFSPSVTSFASADMAVRQRPHLKKYKLRTGRVNVSHSHKPEHTKATDQETCDSWRKRGNEAYKSGDLSEAEVCYSKGISSIQHTETPGVCIQPLLLCYSNRAATRMALGRMREGLNDCRMAAALDPNFMKVNLRSANCHLLLGEVDDASYYYNKCLESEEIVCLDRRITIEAAEGLQKAQKVSDYLKLAAEILEQKTYESATNALGTITDALSISSYSEKLLNMKGEALLMLGKHKEVVQLCEQTLDTAEKNFSSVCKISLRLWRWNLMSKSYFHLGRLEIALDLMEKHEQLRSKIVGPDESLAHLAVTIRELLHCKNAGNEAFQNGKHTEAVEHYSAAISKSIESHSFAAVCFCNRAAANQSLGEIIDAIGDCSIAIALDTSYPKALSRRATLLEMIRDYKHASDDLQRLISILETQSQNSQNSHKSASNGSVKDLRRARRRLSILEEKAKKERSLDLYLILGLKPTDGAADVKKAYRKAALRHHPDKVNQQWKAIAESIQMDADRLFKMIGEAYAVLSDPAKRSKYDLEEEMWDDMEINVGSSNRRGSDFFGSQESRKSYGYSNGNSHYYYWQQEPRKSYHTSYPRW
ncbi:uncharacterized protein LOC111888018 isoform X1 [Lactuca sativa]|uniref:uncharacterized protein LOC111888018 isoform X1 n=1 Tax=Lactuca sativa TaxID=4236 RepID=UPI000CB725FD|nr:uncharacterized protein LOC111888018 isoform X1 [Lactuca sativa]